MREVAVVGEQDQAGGVEVQPADGVQPFAAGTSDDGARPCGSLAVRDDAAGLLRGYTTGVPGRLHAPPVDLDRARVVDVARRVRDDLPSTVTRPSAMIASGGAPRGDSGVGEVLGESQVPATIGGVDLDLLDATLAEAQPAFRARQVWRWAANGAQRLRRDDRPAGRAAREAAGGGPVLTLELVREAHASDGTVKAPVPHARRPRRRGRADALPRRPPLGVRVLAVRLPADVHVLRHRDDEVRPQPDRGRDPRPGAALPPHRAASTTSCSWAWASR